MRVQTQTWHTLTRHILISDHGTVQLELYNEPKGSLKVEAYIWALWIDAPHRRKKAGTYLLDYAERMAKNAGYPCVFLEWCPLDTPEYVLEWYKRNGYEEVAYNDDNKLLRKVFKQKK